MSLGPAMAMGIAGGMFNAYSAGQQQDAAAEAQRNANQFNYAASKDQQAFQEYMSNSAYERAAASMERAGINPLLAAGGAASTPQGSMSTASPEVRPSGSGMAAKALADSISNALNFQQVAQDMRVKDAQANFALESARTEQTKQTTNLANARQSAAQEAKLDSERFLNEHQYDLSARTFQDQLRTKKARLNADETKARLDREQSTIDRDNIQFDNINKRISAGLGTASSAVDLINPMNKLIPKSRGTDRVIDSKTGEILQESRR